jgi:hypothetical protein
LSELSEPLSAADKTARSAWTATCLAAAGGSSADTRRTSSLSHAVYSCLDYGHLWWH